MPDAKKSIKFWSELWDNPVNHDRNSEWIMTVEKELECVIDLKAASLTKDAGRPSQFDSEQYQHILSSRKFKKEKERTKRTDSSISQISSI